MSNVVVGEKAQEFELLATDELKFSLSEQRGSVVVLYFYPRDSTPGCTQEGKDFTELYPEFQKNEALIFGISRDSVSTHQKFKEKQGYVFPLLADIDESVCEKYGVIVDRVTNGKKVRGLERSTFLINKEGLLVQEWRKVQVSGHAGEVLKAVKVLNN